ncbi:MAG: aspartyl protease family protein [Gammaproteobacteria bacterium]|nr:aspartyl protease family protein [Gammaproteobacteria bacterium]
MPISVTRFSGSFRDDQGNEHQISPPQALRQRGPVLTATLTLSDRQQQAEAASGRGSRSVSGSVLIDTGASQTCVDQQAANELGLTIFGTGRMTSASHSDVEVPLFVGKIVLPNITINVEGAMGAQLEEQGLIALIGRDLLQNAVLVYNGVDGSVTLST